MNAVELAEQFSLEELREAFDAISTIDHVVRGHEESEYVIGGRTVTTTPARIGDAKLVKRGWTKPGKTRPRRRR